MGERCESLPHNFVGYRDYFQIGIAMLIVVIG